MKAVMLAGRGKDLTLLGKNRVSGKNVVKKIRRRCAFFCLLYQLNKLCILQKH